MKLYVTDAVFFVRAAREVTESIFAPVNGHTAAGTFQVRKHGVLFCDLSGEPVAWICTHRPTPFLVTASASPATGGRVRFAHGLASYSARALGLDANDASACRRAAERIADQVEALKTANLGNR